MTKNEIINSIKFYLNKNTLDNFLEVIRDVNNYNRRLLIFDMYKNDDDFFNEYFKDACPATIVECISKGRYKFNEDYVCFESIYGWAISYSTANAIEYIREYIELILEEISNVVIRDGIYIQINDSYLKELITEYLEKCSEGR